jgi:hypothetical protein
VEFKWDIPLILTFLAGLKLGAATHPRVISNGKPPQGRSMLRASVVDAYSWTNQPILHWSTPSYLKLTRLVEGMMIPAQIQL